MEVTSANPTPVSDDGPGVNFDDWPQTMARLYSHYGESVREKIAILRRFHLVQPAGMPSCALDIGCGTAPWAAAAAACGYQAVGLDKSANMLAMARQHNPDMALITADFQQWQPDRLYDLVIAGGNQATYYPDCADFARRLAACLAPGGRALLSMRDFRATCQQGSDATLLTRTRHPNGSETVVVDYRRLIAGKRADCSFWIIAPCDPGEAPKQWQHHYTAWLHSWAELRLALTMAGLTLSATFRQPESGYFFPLVIARKLADETPNISE